MKRKILITVAFCLIMITTIGAAASSLGDLPGYADALSAATGTTSGAAPSGSIRSLPGYQGVIDYLKVMPGAAPSGSIRSLPGYQSAIDDVRGMPGKSAPYPGTLQRINSNDRDYDLVYTDAYNQKFTLYLNPSNISPNTLPPVIATAVPVTVYLNGIYSVTFVYNNVEYTAPQSTTTLNTPYLTYEAHYDGRAIGGDAIFGTVWLNTFDGTTLGEYVATPASGVDVQVLWNSPTPPVGWIGYNTGSTSSSGHFCVKGPSETNKNYKAVFTLGDLSVTTNQLSSTDRPSYCS